MSDGTVSYFTYSATNGNFWVPDSGEAIAWETADVRIRNAAGEARMPGTATPRAGCNGCHNGGAQIIEPN